jgi:competence protein ComEA
VWLPLCLKALGVLAGMLALAAIGASSLAKGPGVPLTSSAQRSAGMTAGAAPGAKAPEAPRPAESTSPHPGVVPAADAADAGSEPSDAGVPSAALTPDGKVILNLASMDELRRLPGVGPKRAEAILALRAKLGGRFKRITDLLRVKGIGTKGLKKIEANAVLDAPKA